MHHSVLASVVARGGSVIIPAGVYTKDPMFNRCSCIDGRSFFRHSSGCVTLKWMDDGMYDCTTFVHIQFARNGISSASVGVNMISGYKIGVPKNDNASDYKPGMTCGDSASLRFTADSFRDDFLKRHNACKCSFSPPPPPCHSNEGDQTNAFLKMVSGGKASSCAMVKAQGDCSMGKGGAFCCTTCGHGFANSVAPSAPTGSSASKAGLSLLVPVVWALASA
jgi:hypothetical protein